VSGRVVQCMGSLLTPEMHETLAGISSRKPDSTSGTQWGLRRRWSREHSSTRRPRSITGVVTFSLTLVVGMLAPLVVASKVADSAKCSVANAV